MRSKKTLICGWSLISAGLLVLFWTIYLLATGDVPAIYKIVLWDQWKYDQSVHISRWWDIAIGPIWATAFIVMMKDRFNNNEEDEITLCSSAILGLLAGLITGGIIGVNTWLVACLILCILSASLGGPVAILGACLGGGLSLGLTVGVTHGLIIFLPALVCYLIVTFFDSL